MRRSCGRERALQSIWSGLSQNCTGFLCWFDQLCTEFGRIRLVFDQRRGKVSTETTGGTGPRGIASTTSGVIRLNLGCLARAWTRCRPTQGRARSILPWCRPSLERLTWGRSRASPWIWMCRSRSSPYNDKKLMPSLMRTTLQRSSRRGKPKVSPRAPHVLWASLAPHWDMSGEF